MERADWLRQMRDQAEVLYDHFSPLYWVKAGLGASETHREFLAKFLDRVPAEGALLSAACGAGRFDGMLLEAGHSVLGIDQSEGMLARAIASHPVLGKKAERHFRRALTLDPQNADLHFALGRYYQTFDMKGRALSEYKTALRIDPNHTEARKAVVEVKQSGSSSMDKVMKRLFGSPRNLETHLGEKKTKCDYAVPRALTSEDIVTIERTVNAAIERDHPITVERIRADRAKEYDLSKIPEDTDEIRIVHIGDFDAIPCSGEPVAHTGQIGRFRVKSFTMRDGHIARIRFTLEDD